MASWRLGEREVGSSKPSSSQPKKKNPYDDDDEFDFGASKPQAQGSTSKGDRAASSTEPSYEDLMNPHKFVLIRGHVKRTAGAQSLGMEIKATGSLLKVTSLGDAAAKAGLEKDTYLVAMEGKRVKSEQEFKEMEASERKPSVRITVAKRRAAQYQPGSFPLPSFIYAKNYAEYHLLRLDPTDGTHVGVGIGEKDGYVCVTQVVAGNAGQKAGVKEGDRVMAVDWKAVQTKDNCKELVQESAGNPFDMIVERQGAAPPPPPPPPPKPKPPPPPVRIEPDMREDQVPQVPVDVSMIMDNNNARSAVANILKSKRATKRKSVQKPPVSSEKTANERPLPPRSVRMDKKIVKKTLKQSKRQ